MVRRVGLGAVLIVVVMVGTMAQAGAHLFGFTTGYAQSRSAVTAGRYGETGPSPVGTRHLGAETAPLNLTLWYPALEPEAGAPSAEYVYGVTMFGPESVTALATFAGIAVPNGPFDTAGGPYPLVILSHGFGMTPGSHAWLGEHLASHGIVVVAPQHRESLDPGSLWQATVDRPRDIERLVRFLDEEARSGGVLDGLIDLDSKAVIGHSYGGYAALAAAGARLDAGGFEESCEALSSADPLAFLCDALRPFLDDIATRAGLASTPAGLWPAQGIDRFDAVVTLAGDAAMFGESGLSEVTVPVMAIGGTADTDSPFEWGTRLTYENVSSRHKVQVALEDAGHLVFAAECDRVRRIMTLVSLGFCDDPAWERTEAHEVVRSYVTAFLLAELEGDGRAAGSLDPDLQDLEHVGYRAEGY